MFDLIQGYHPAVLSSVEHSKIKDWFSMSSNNRKVDSNDPRKITQSGLTWPKPPVMHQGKLVAGIPNWFTRYLAINFSAAMVGGNQENVTYWADSGWPHDLFTFDRVTSSWPPDDQNRYNIVTSLLAVYADGANSNLMTAKDIATRTTLGTRLIIIRLNARMAVLIILLRCRGRFWER
jgi:hypothetical protein